ncbi:hypothetical protein [Clostridium botulinum]|uniref:hypothetical protein n=1 Tax=Clostridium botulinum TaxID=1491 RepID=UPI0002FEFC1D|nr:hypothetical protein [Clostridium botulinum]KEH97603.1 hypothetical protein Z953_01770 [Clostridium botulinum D str. 16868]KLU76967.1 hypothetical protein CBC3_00975 [Clostridium botulinum V891]KOA79303.1 hypothetical protein ADU78_00075 [Clostridium botulinum]KOA92107.1 hypothetical protein ADU76_09655 [Clostridium botulinum]MCD3204118.1 hypothetical protein [Clostridium botulinum C/D]
MKKVIIGSIIFILVFILAFYSKFSYLGTMKGNIISKESNTSVTTFIAKNEDKINFIRNSSVKQGTIKLILINPKGKIIKNFQRNKNYSEQICLDTDGEYKFRIAYDNFIGNYTVKYK